MDHRRTQARAISGSLLSWPHWSLGAILTASSIVLSLGCNVEAQGKQESAATSLAPQLRSAPCDGYGSRADCFWATVPEDRTQLDGRKIDLWIVVVRAKSGSSAEPVLFFPGGPGQATTDLVAFSQDLFGDALRARDAVYIGQRGTGQSHSLHCYEGIDKDASASFGQLFDLDVVRECYQGALERANPSHYRTGNYVADIRDVLDWLGYDQVLLWGGSGGTRTAQSFLRENPERVVATALIGVAPLDLAMPLPFAGFVERAWQRVVADCAADPACDAAFPDLNDDMTTIRNRLEKGAIETEVVDLNGKQVSVEMALGDFAYAVRGMLYSGQGVSRLPKLVTAAAQTGDLSQFARAHYQRSLGLRGGLGLSLGVHLSSYCSEDVPQIDPEAVATEVAGTLIGSYLVDQYSAACTAWPVAAAPKQELEAVRSDSPVLLVSGHYDPSTPDIAAERVRATLPNSRHVIVRDRGHDAGFGCAASAIVDFLRDGSFEDFENPCDERRIRFETGR